MNTFRRHTVISFLLGLALGIAGGSFGLHHFARAHFREGKMENWMVHRLNRKLDLTPEQKSGVEAIFKESHQKMDLLRQEMAPKFDALRKETRDRIRILLTPPQQTKFDQLESKWEAQAKRWHGRGEDHPR
jgi:hypothetical protein